MNSAKVIKFPSHCSSSFLARMNKTERCNWRFQVLASLRLFVFFFFLHTNMHHLYCRDWEGKWTYLVLEWRRRWWCCVLCFTVSSASVQFASISPSSSLLMLSHYFSTLFFQALLRCLPHVFLCLLSLVPPLCSVLPLAFIARGRKRYFGNSRVHHGGEEHQSRDAPPDWKRFPYHCQRLLPLMPQLLCLRRQWILLQWNGAVWISSEYIYFSSFFFLEPKNG